MKVGFIYYWRKLWGKTSN